MLVKHPKGDLSHYGNTMYVQILCVQVIYSFIGVSEIYYDVYESVTPPFKGLASAAFFSLNLFYIAFVGFMVIYFHGLSGFVFIIVFHFNNLHENFLPKE